MKVNKKKSKGVVPRNASESRFYRKALQKVNGIFSAVEMKMFLGSVHKMPKSRGKALILLATASRKIIKAKLGLERGEWQLLAQSRLMRAAIFDNTLGLFTPAFLLLPDWETANNAFYDALKKVGEKVPGAQGLKDTALTNLQTILKKALAYVNGLCLDSQSTAVSIIGAALMMETKTKARETGPITVSQGNGTGILTCSCPRARKDGVVVQATYEKGYTSDEGRTWTDLAADYNSKAEAPDLTVGTGYQFRSRYKSKHTGLTAYIYSQVVYVL